ncbi:methyltransferase family protein [Croceicoccus bisphenolivorans]|uniref:methyltransferase family protein n=1 Tax=Croceicoccus bisphenolivorans TaxID=1783232 RepID=UPI00082B3947|nr:isoprenylcysteine carboxylmethyltransferase family protein [Croceicoccus bisphenolivorans]
MSLFSIDEDSAKVRFPPPLVFIGFLLIGWLVDDLFGLNPAIPAMLRWLLGAVAIVSGLAVIAMALLRFRQSGNPPEPWKRDTAFVAEGIYRLSRNPMYLGMALLAFGIAVATNSLGSLLTLPLSIIAIQTQVIRREEAYLSRTFGQAYEDYCNSVRRWI